jgi:hypothetical protein
LLRYLQVGRVQAYALTMVVGLGAVGWYFIAPRAEAKIASNAATGAYSVTATPGIGYSYRWDENGDGKFEEQKFSNKTEVSFELKPNTSRKLTLEVRNAFGRTATRELTVARPKTDKSALSPEERAQRPNPGQRPQRPLPGGGHP